MLAPLRKLASSPLLAFLTAATVIFHGGFIFYLLHNTRGQATEPITTDNEDSVELPIPFDFKTNITGYDDRFSLHQHNIRNGTFVPSCVSHCINKVEFVVDSFDEAHPCSSEYICRFHKQVLEAGLFSISSKQRRKTINGIAFPDYEEEYKSHHITCESPTRGICKMPGSTDCSGSSMNDWNVRVEKSPSSTNIENKKEDVTESHIMEIKNNIQSRLVITPHRTFEIKSVFPNQKADEYVVVGFFFPRTLFPDKCNQIYCIYQNPLTNATEQRVARLGDISFSYCPVPKSKEFTIPSTILRMTYDFKIFTLPFPLHITEPFISDYMGNVRMTICSIVKNEGVYLQPWIEYHIMMGYARFILYDNNAEKDTMMEQVIENYDKYIIRVPWPHRHAQTEALTDCTHRFGPFTKWMTFIDVDEYLVPGSSYKTVRELLTTKYPDRRYISSPWLVFGPCGETALPPTKLLFEVCHYVTKTFRWLSKPTFQPKYVAGIQGYGPHAIRLVEDIGEKNSYSSTFTSTHLTVYHYRYGLWDDFRVKRLGDTAGRMISRTEKDVKKMWDIGIRRSLFLPRSKNNIYRYIPYLKRRLGLSPEKESR